MIKQSDLNASIRDIPLPMNMRHLPVSRRGYPVPYFIKVRSGDDWDFRVIIPEMVVDCLITRKCWICGQQTGRLQAFVAGPMCIITRTTAEPASHPSCARYAAIACPFLANPRMKRDMNDLPEGHWQPGRALLRNPGVSAVLITRQPTRPFNDGRDNLLMRMGEPDQVEWYAERRPATRAEVEASVDSGVAALYKLAEVDNSREDLEQQIALFRKWLPPEECKQTVDKTAVA
jgi:hypothetical protein